MSEWDSNKIVTRYCQLAGLSVSVTSDYDAEPSTDGSWKIYKQVPVYRELSESEGQQQEDAQIGMLNATGLYWPPENESSGYTEEFIGYDKEFVGILYPPDKFVKASEV